MKCPFCEYENLPGEDFCDACGQSLTDDRLRVPFSSSLEANIEHDPLAVLKPAVPITVPSTAKVSEVIRLLADKNIGCVLVVWGDNLVGIFSERDLLMRIGTRVNEVANEPIRHFMTPAPETLAADDTIAFALNRMAVGDFRHVPISVDDKLTGIISIRDVLAYLAEHFPEVTAETNS